MSTSYRELERHFATISALRGAAAMLHWDAAVIMPPGSSEVRAEQQATLAELAHEKLTAHHLGDLLAEAESDPQTLDDWQKANLREMRRIWRHETAVSSRLVRALSEACSRSEMFWREARARNDFAGFIPHLERVVALVRETAACKAELFGCTPYDALLDGYDPGMRSEEVDRWFDELSDFLPPFTQEVLEAQRRRPQPQEPQGPFPIATQKQLGEQFMHALGFDFQRGRLDISHHPFCGGVPGDVRITTRYREDQFSESLMGVLHETGHARYEMNLPNAWRSQPVGEARGMSLHESQSLLVEMQLCRSYDFLCYAAPVLRHAFGGSAKAWDPENLHALFTRVEPGLIRVSADEVTYPSHVILRYQIEKALIGGDLAVRDLPDAWDEGMRALLGVVPGNHANGCMQDIHWPDGAFGYFPTYTLGAMMAAQIFAAMRRALPDIGTHIRCGEFAPLFDWLAAHVHGMGSFYGTQELLQHATGQTLNPAIYMAHLRERYIS